MEKEEYHGKAGRGGGQEPEKERELRNTKQIEYLQSMINAITESAFLMKPDGEVIAANKTVAKRLGLSSSAEMIGRNVFSLIPPDVAEKRRGFISRAVETGEPVKEVDQRGERIIHNSIYPVVEDDGSVSSLAVIGTDVTHLKEVERELRNRTAALEEVQRKAQIGRWELDHSTGALEWSSTIYEIFGLDESEFDATYEAFLQAVHPDDRDLVDEAFKRSVENREPYSIEHRLLNPDGDVKWVRESCRTEYDGQGMPVRSIGFVQDISDYKHVEENLRRSRELLDTAENMSGIGGWEWDVDRKKLTWTDELYRLHGVERDRISSGSEGLRDFSISCYDLADQARIAESLDRCIKDGVPYDIECGFTSADGTYRRVRTRGQAVEENGRVVRVIGSFMDITELKRAQEALEKRLIALTQPLGDDRDVDIGDLFNLEDLQRIQDEFADAFHVASVITLPDGTPLTKQSNFTRLCSGIIRKTQKGLENCYKSDAALGRYETKGPIVEHCRSCGLWDAGASISVGGRHVASWLIGQVRDESQSEADMIAYARDIGADVDDFIEAFREVQSMPRENFQKIADLLFTLSNQLSDMAYQNMQQARFITERRHAEQTLLEEKSWSEAVINSAPVIVVALGEQSRIRIFNAFAERLTGYQAAEVMGESWIDLFVPEEQREELYGVWKQIMSERLIEHHFENEILTRDGRKRMISWSNSILEPGGEETVVLSIGEDITAQKTAQKEQDELRAQLAQAQKMESIGRLAGGVAHDFNNMLSVILGQIELALDDAGSEHPLAENLQEVQKAAERSAGLTRQLLAFARKQAISPKVVDLNQVIADMLRMLRRLIGEDIELDWGPGKGIYSVRIDPSQLGQILTNLCVNARDAISSRDQKNTTNGIITIETGTRTLDSEFCSTHPGAVPGDYCWFSVQDNGIGMDQGTIDKLFEPFYTTKKVGEGTGLGLPSVYGAVKQNSGFIEVESVPGIGSVFTIYLHRHPEIQHETDPGRPGVSGENQGTILLVEDEPSILKVTRRMLERFGYTVLSASQPKESLDLARSYTGRIDLLLSDVIMPDMTGRELADALLTTNPEMKRLFMSGYTADVIANHGVLDPGVFFIQKPFSMADLAEKVREAIELD